MRILSIFFLAIVLTLASCKKNEHNPSPLPGSSPDRYKGTIAGRIYEGNTKEPVKGVKIILQDRSVIPAKVLDSTYSNEDGNYWMDVKGSESGVNYCWTVRDIPIKYAYSTPNNQFQFGRHNYNDVAVYETGTIKVRVIFTGQLENAPVNVSTSLGTYTLPIPGNQFIHGTSADTTVSLPFIPNSPIDLSFTVDWPGPGSIWKIYKLPAISNRLESPTVTYTLNFNDFVRAPW